MGKRRRSEPHGCGDGPKPSSVVTAQVLGAGRAGFAPSVLLNFEAHQSKFLFGAGEGTQRFSFEHKFRLGKVTNVWLPTMDSATTVHAVYGDA